MRAMIEGFVLTEPKASKYTLKQQNSLDNECINSVGTAFVYFGSFFLFNNILK